MGHIHLDGRPRLNRDRDIDFLYQPAVSQHQIDMAESFNEDPATEILELTRHRLNQKLLNGQARTTTEKFNYQLKKEQLAVLREIVDMVFADPECTSEVRENWKRQCVEEA